MLQVTWAELDTAFVALPKLQRGGRFGWRDAKRLSELHQPLLYIVHFRRLLLRLLLHFALLQFLFLLLLAPLFQLGLLLL